MDDDLMKELLSNGIESSLDKGFSIQDILEATKMLKEGVLQAIRAEEAEKEKNAIEQEIPCSNASERSKSL